MPLGLKPKNCLIALLGSCILAFGLYHIHSFSQVTEGGQLGLTLLLQHWFSISPAVTNFVANVICYLLGWKLLGRKFIIYSAVATVSFSVSYWIIEQFPPLWPQLADMPLLAALVGAVFVGIGCGFCVKVGGAVSGDDALAMCISHTLRINIQWAYLITDLTVLGLSLTYIPVTKIAYSLLTVLLSGQIIGWIQKLPFAKE